MGLPTDATQRSLRRRLGGMARLGTLAWVHALLGGLAAWLVALIARSFLVVPACGMGLPGRGLLVAVSGAGVALTAHALLTAVRFGGLGDAASERMTAVTFLATVGVLLNVVSLLLIVGETIPVAFIDPCTGV